MQCKSVHTRNEMHQNVTQNIEKKTKRLQNKRSQRKTHKAEHEIQEGNVEKKESLAEQQQATYMQWSQQCETV